MSLLGTAVTGLMAQQEALKTTGQNISNAGTPGYSRQEVVMESSNALFRGFGYIGQGVEVTTVRRVHDQFLTNQLRTDTSSFHDLQAYRENIEQVDRIMADSKTGLQPQMDRYFAALQGAADNPSYIPSRDVVLGEAQGLTDRFETLSRYMHAQNETLNGQMQVVTSQVNAISSGIAGLNEEIVSASGSASSAPPNDLLDKRDELVRQLSELVTVDVIEVDGTYNISIGTGQALVLGYSANTLEASASLQDPNRYGIRYQSSVESLDITDSIKGGQLGGMLDFRAQALDKAINSLGRIAVVFVQETNAQQKLGIDLEGAFGTDFFRDMNDPSKTGERVYAYSSNSLPNDRLFNVTFTDTGELSTSEYELRLPGPGSARYQVTRKDDGQIVQEGALSGGFPQTLSFDGLDVVLEGGTFQQGDTFTIAPLRFAARTMETLLKQPSEIALGFPIKAETSLSNLGSGYINQGTMLSRDSAAFAEDSQLSPPMIVKFLSPTRYSILDNTDPGNPVSLVPPQENIEFIPGSANTIFTSDPDETALSSWRARLPATPAIGMAGPSVDPLSNGINPERFNFFLTDPITGKETQLPTLSTLISASANEIATQVNRVEGVTARSYTEVQLTDFSNSGTPYNPDMPFEVWVDGYDLTSFIGSANQNTYMDGFPEEIPDAMNANFLADRINSHFDLAALGVHAKSDGDTLTIMDDNGNDILIEIRGDKPQGVITGASPLPASLPANINGAIDPGDSFMVSNGERWQFDALSGDTLGLLSNETGYNFDLNGPYVYQMYLPDGRKGTIELTGNLLDGDAVKAEIETKLNKLLDSTGQTKVFISETGYIDYQVYNQMAGQGNQNTSRMNIGGQVDLVMQDGVRLTTDPMAGSIFSDLPDALPTYMGFQFELGGRPESGDEFIISWNSDGVSDNRNALLLVGLETKETINNADGGLTFTESYSQTVAKIATLTSQAQIRSDSSRAVLEGSQAEINSVQGVNLDEEAARLIEFQAAYNANAKVIAIAQELFDSLLAAV
ncbi:flagellar hook-associated protein FlgK [Reinekea sp.]|jgi:flagellar hook-associated protein 1 FlgK|uniref:flagellar hook-associated protein FlgK n=1 Tax=Reinekea sp. TaxID=1970455 RepID=UPI002A81F305|nr:flagellar hook-associated protein FlgK [Reinekea sp.]